MVFAEKQNIEIFNNKIKPKLSRVHGTFIYEFVIK
jgi:hypothetical protein